MNIKVMKYPQILEPILFYGEEWIGYIRLGDGEILLKDTIIDKLTDDEFFYLLKIGRKPDIWFKNA